MTKQYKTALYTARRHGWMRSHVDGRLLYMAHTSISGKCFWITIHTHFGWVEKAQ